MSTLRVSIVIPTYNHTVELKRTIDSIRSQTFTNHEVIVVDDGSKNPIVESPHYRLIRKANGGAPSARNRGLSESRGEYVIFWDADLIAEPDMLEKMVFVLDAQPEITFVYSSHKFGWKKMPAQAFSVEALQERNYIHSTSLLRRNDALLWDESLEKFQDWDYWLTLVEQGKKGYWIDEYLFTVSPGGTMSVWLPSFAYKKPWSLLPGVRKRVKKYNEARQIIKKKHSL